MTTILTVKADATDSFEYRQAELAAKLDELKTLVAMTPEDIHWGHVGSLAYVEEKVDEALRHLGN